VFYREIKIIKILENYILLKYEKNSVLKKKLKIFFDLFCRLPAAVVRASQFMTSGAEYSTPPLILLKTQKDIFFKRHSIENFSRITGFKTERTSSTK
jgi:hypothetical protein